MPEKIFATLRLRLVREIRKAEEIKQPSTANTVGSTNIIMC